MVRTVLDHYRAELPDVSTLTYYEPSLTTRIFAADGTLIGTLYRENRTWTKLEDISPSLLMAILSIEDSRFYTHRGVDPKGVARAVMSKLTGSGGKQGASTITMQLARALFLSPKQTIDRKLKEVLVATEIEKNFTKDEVLELYLNQIYLGSGAYGVHAAADLYFGKKPKDLTPAEASLIAGLPQAPSDYSPFVDEESAKKRQKLVLGRMKTVRTNTLPAFVQKKLKIPAGQKTLLTEEQYKNSIKEVEGQKYTHRKKKEFVVLKVPYFTSYVIKQLYKQFDEEMLFRGGLNIYTTVDLKLQEKAELIVKELVARDKNYLNVSQAASVTVENGTGYIRSMVGGTGWKDKAQFNRAWQAERQPGSSFKTFVYTTAVECGFPPSTAIPDSPINIDGWKPNNSDGKFYGPMSMANGMRQSRNTVAIRALQLGGVNRVIETARKMGIKGKLRPVPSLALGAADLTVLEMADAVSTIPNGGVRIPATPIKLITDRDGNVVVDNRFPKKTDVISESTASSLMEMMRGVVQGGTAPAAYIPNHEAAGKTGTTDSYRDAWFVGYTRDYTTAVWCGNDDYSRMWRAFGGDLPARIWRATTVFANRNTESTRLPITRPSKVGLLMCADSKQRIGPKCPKSYRDSVPRYGVPRTFCRVHGAPAFTPGKLKDKGDKSKDSDSSPTDEAAETAAETAEPAVPIEPDAAPVPTQVEIPVEIPLTEPGGEPAIDPGVIDPGAADPGVVELPPPVEPVEAQPVEIPPPPPAPVDLPPPPPPEPVVVPVAPPPPVEVPPPPPEE